MTTSFFSFVFEYENFSLRRANFSINWRAICERNWVSSTLTCVMNCMQVIDNGGQKYNTSIYLIEMHFRIGKQFLLNSGASNSQKTLIVCVSLSVPSAGITSSIDTHFDWCYLPRNGARDTLVATMLFAFQKRCHRPFSSGARTSDHLFFDDLLSFVSSDRFRVTISLLSIIS